MKNTSISVPENILDAIQKYNIEHPDEVINMAAECRKGLRKKLIDVGVKL